MLKSIASGSLNTAATGTEGSPNRSTIDAANCEALSRRSIVGPGLSPVHALSAAKLTGGGGIIEPLPPP